MYLFICLHLLLFCLSSYTRPLARTLCAFAHHRCILYVYTCCTHRSPFRAIRFDLSSSVWPDLQCCVIYIFMHHSKMFIRHCNLESVSASRDYSYIQLTTARCAHTCIRQMGNWLFLVNSLRNPSKMCYVMIYNGSVNKSYANLRARAHSTKTNSLTACWECMFGFCVIFHAKIEQMVIDENERRKKRFYFHFKWLLYVCIFFVHVCMHRLHRLLPVEIKLRRLCRSVNANKTKSDICKAWNFCNTPIYANLINTQLNQIQFKCLTSPVAGFCLRVQPYLFFHFWLLIYSRRLI